MTLMLSYSTVIYRDDSTVDSVSGTFKVLPLYEILEEC